MANNKNVENAIKAIQNNDAVTLRKSIKEALVAKVRQALSKKEKQIAKNLIESSASSLKESVVESEKKPSTPEEIKKQIEELKQKIKTAEANARRAMRYGDSAEAAYKYQAADEYEDEIKALTAKLNKTQVSIKEDYKDSVKVAKVELARVEKNVTSNKKEAASAAKNLLDAVNKIPSMSMAVDVLQDDAKDLHKSLSSGTFSSKEKRLVDRISKLLSQSLELD